MDITYWIDLEKNGVKIGRGPIKSAISWSSEIRLGEAGQFTCTISAVDEQIEYIAPYVTLICRVVVAGYGVVEIGRGEARDIKTTIDEDGKAVIEVKGLDDAGRLNDSSVGFLEIGGGTNTKTLREAFYLIRGSILEAGGVFPWSLDDSGYTGTHDIYYEFSGETVMAALAKVTELADAYFVLVGNTIYFRSNDNFPDCGVRAIATPPNPNPLEPSTCYIVGTPGITEETEDVYTRVRPVGRSRGEESISLKFLTDQRFPPGYNPSPPAEPVYTIYSVNGSLAGIRYAPAEVPGAQGYPGRIIERWRRYQDIEAVLPDRPESADGSPAVPYTEAERLAAKQTAARMLFEVALRDLRNSLTKTVHYDLSLLHCNQVIRVGQGIRCVFSYRYGTGWVRVNDMLNITATRLVVDSNGIRTTNLTVSPVARPPRLDFDPLLRLYAWQNRFS